MNEEQAGAIIAIGMFASITIMVVAKLYFDYKSRKQ